MHQILRTPSGNIAIFDTGQSSKTVDFFGNKDRFVISATKEGTLFTLSYAPSAPDPLTTLTSWYVFASRFS
jgi:hypothetical protein